MTIYIYILKLIEGKYYIGKSINPTKRIKNHYLGKGSYWTKIYKPVSIETQFVGNNWDEDNYTLQYMHKYGIDNVRGGSFCQISLDEDSINTIKRMINGATNKCFKCGSNDHYLATCELRVVTYDREDDDDFVRNFFNKNEKMKNSYLYDCFLKIKNIICGLL